jgi:hypothetical protein
VDKAPSLILKSCLQANISEIECSGIEVGCLIFPPAKSQPRKIQGKGEIDMSFPKWIWACMTLACLSATSFVAYAANPSYSAIYVFGDSYCDVGNIYFATGGAQPPAPYYAGRFSNGPIWVEHVASAMGLPMTPSLEGGTDFAFGGAWVTQPQVTPQGTIPDVPQQVGLYLSLHGGKADPNALYILEGGGNDIVGNLSSGISASQLGFEIAAGISEGELLLRRAGARNFLISDLLNVGLLPARKPIRALRPLPAWPPTNPSIPSWPSNHFLREFGSGACLYSDWSRRSIRIQPISGSPISPLPASVQPSAATRITHSFGTPFIRPSSDTRSLQ